MNVGVKVALISLAVILALILLTELGLRLFLGLGNPLVYVTDPQIGYLLAPNQQVRRFGNRIEINQFSMRGSPISPRRSEQTWRIVLLGDSIANGGWWTDQSATLSTLLEQGLQSAATSKRYERVEVLNASANSWGPRNELAYLQRFGSFEAQIILLLINTDDLFGIAPTSVPVGRDRTYPSHKPALALIELVNRYIRPPAPVPEMDALYQEGGDRVGFNLAAIEGIRVFAQQQYSTLIVAMTPLLREMGSPGSREYERVARQRLQEYLTAQGIPYLDFLPLFNAAPDPPSLYRDHIHLSLSGNQFVTHHLIDLIQNPPSSPPDELLQ